MANKNTYQRPFLDYFEAPLLKGNIKQRVSIESLYESIKKNLQKLLSTRMRVMGAHNGYAMERTSVFHYGMPDFMDIQFGSKSGETELCNKISHIVQVYEPRLKNIEVTVLDKRDAYGVLQLRIMADLNMTQVNQVVIYDSQYHPIQSRFLMEA